MENDISSLASSGDVLFMMLGAVMVFAMHGGFAFRNANPPCIAKTITAPSIINRTSPLLASELISFSIIFSPFQNL